MKKVLSVFLLLCLSIFLVGCGKNTGTNKDKTKKSELYFDWTGIAETTHIAFTAEETFDLKTVFKVGDKISAYNKKLGTTTYDDIHFYIYESYGQMVYPTEDDNIKISSDGIVTRKKLCTAVIYAGLKEDVYNISDDDKANENMHVLTLYFGNDKTFGTWEAENSYLDIWIQNKIENGETDAKKGTMTLVLNSDFTYTLTVTKGYWGTSSIDEKLEKDEVITGKLVGLCSSGAMRYDDNQSEIRYDFVFEMNSYYYGEEEKYTLFTGYTSNPESRTWSTYRFLPKEGE